MSFETETVRKLRSHNNETKLQAMIRFPELSNPPCSEFRLRLHFRRPLPDLRRRPAPPWAAST
jgi:hypothetical protein